MTTAPVSAVFEALADPTRLEVLQLLSSGPRRAGELASASGTSAPTMSRHLRVLLQAGIVTDERLRNDARARLFRLQPESMRSIRVWLDELQAHADVQLASFKRHAEGKGKR